MIRHGTVAYPRIQGRLRGVQPGDGITLRGPKSARLTPGLRLKLGLISLCLNLQQARRDGEWTAAP